MSVSKSLGQIREKRTIRLRRSFKAKITSVIVYWWWHWWKVHKMSTSRGHDSHSMSQFLITSRHDDHSIHIDSGRSRNELIHHNGRSLILELTQKNQQDEWHNNLTFTEICKQGCRLADSHHSRNKLRSILIHCDQESWSSFAREIRYDSWNSAHMSIDSLSPGNPWCFHRTSATVQSCNSVRDDHQFKGEEWDQWETCQKHALKSVNKLARAATKMDQSQMISCIHHASGHWQHCPVGNTARHCRLGSCQDLLTTWITRNQPQGEFYLLWKLNICLCHLDAVHKKSENCVVGCALLWDVAVEVLPTTPDSCQCGPCAEQHTLFSPKINSRTWDGINCFDCWMSWISQGQRQCTSLQVQSRQWSNGTFPRLWFCWWPWRFKINFRFVKNTNRRNWKISFLVRHAWM